MTLELEVRPLADRLDGYGIVAIAREMMTRLGVETGDFVSFDHGSEQATAAFQPAMDIEETGFVALSTSLRKTLSVVEGDEITVTALSMDAAHHVHVNLVDGDPSEIDSDELRSRLNYQILRPGADVSVPLDGETMDGLTVRVAS